MIEYSPTETTDYLLCPQYRAYRWGARWRSRVAGRMELGGTVGKGIHAGLAAHYRGQPAPDRVAYETTLAELGRLRTLGIAWEPALAPEATSLPDKAAWGVQKFLTEPAPAWHVLAVEQRLGKGVVDLIAEDGAGPLVVDTKTTLKLESRFQASRLASYLTSWQLRDYCYRVSEYLKRSVQRATVQLIILGPVFRVIRHPLEFMDVERWLQCWAWPVWQRMEADEDLGMPPRNLTVCHNTGYGYPCAFYGVCWEGRALEDVAVREPRREREVADG